MTPREQIEAEYDVICTEHRREGINTMQCAIDYRLVAAERDEARDRLATALAAVKGEER